MSARATASGCYLYGIVSCGGIRDFGIIVIRILGTVPISDQPRDDDPAVL